MRGDEEDRAKGAATDGDNGREDDEDNRDEEDVEEDEDEEKEEEKENVIDGTCSMRNEATQTIEVEK